MSTVDVVGGATASRSTGAGFDALSSDQFMKIVLTELSQQDPFKPQDTSALIQQLSDLRNIESQEALGRQMQALVAQNELAQAAGLIGHIISGIDETNTRVIDYVVSVSRTENGAVLNLRDGWRVAMSKVDEIVTEDALFGPPSGDDDEENTPGEGSGAGS